MNKNWNTAAEKKWQDRQFGFTSKKEREISFNKVVKFLKQNGINFKAVENDPQCCFEYSIKEVRYMNELSLLLHEAGHAVCNHKPAYNSQLKRMEQSDSEVLKKEVEAWNVGVQIMLHLKIKDENYAAWAEECLETYQLV